MMILMVFILFYFIILGYITPDEVRIAFKKIQINLTPTDLDSMFKYFNLSNMNKINVKEFSQNFSASALK